MLFCTLVSFKNLVFYTVRIPAFNHIPTTADFHKQLVSYCTHRVAMETVHLQVAAPSPVEVAFFSIKVTTS